MVIVGELPDVLEAKRIKFLTPYNRMTYFTLGYISF